MEMEMILSVQVSGDGHCEEVVGMSIYDAENAAFSWHSSRRLKVMKSIRGWQRTRCCFQR